MKKVVAIIGPTAVGKTALSIAIAKRYDTEIISGDSTQVYKGLDIGTAKIKEHEKEGIIHHFIDIVEPTETYDVKHYQKDARNIINQGKNMLIVGGTGLYIKAVLDHYDFTSGGRDFDFEKQYENHSNEAIYNELLSLNKDIALKLHPNNRRRVLRALYLEKENQHISYKKDEPFYNYLIIYLSRPRKELYERINKRALLMFEEGLIDEVKALRNKGIRPNIINYKQVNDYLDGNLMYEEMILEIQKVTRRYAKRQETWFNHQMKTVKINIKDQDAALKEIFKHLDEFWG